MAKAGSERVLSKHQLKVALQNGLKINRGQGFIFYDGPWLVEISTPKSNRVTRTREKLRGRFCLLEFYPEVSLRIKQGKTTKHVEYKVTAPKIRKLAIRHREFLKTIYSFQTDIEIRDKSSFKIEINFGGKGWRTMCQLDLYFDNEQTVQDLKVKDLSNRMAEHQKLISDKNAYFYESTIKPGLKLSKDDPKLLAFYLPQFHPIPENDTWWGEGFTEWANVAADQPRFIGHEQPKLPADLGYYDLRVETAMEQQINMARQYGIYGFCFYYYWFSGRKLLERPIQTLIKNRSWDFNFMICWANENWTRQWDGQYKDVLIAQKHSKEDPLNFIKDVEHILLDKRYIRYRGKPVLAVYRPSDLGNPKRYSDIWRQYFNKRHKTGLYIIGVQSFNYDDPITFGFDQSLDFAPLSFFKYIKELPEKNIDDKLLVSNFSGQVYDLRSIIKTMAANHTNNNALPGVLANWDNDARKKGNNSSIYQGGNPDLYGMWLDKALAKAVDKDKPDFVYINAWNEWAEGAYLEPDKFYGHALLNRTSQVLAKHTKNKTNQSRFPLYSIKRKRSTKLAVIAHIYYPEFWPVLKKKLKVLKSADYDLFITLPRKNNNLLKEIRSVKSNAYIYFVPNRGRDVLPFLHLCRRLRDVGYEYVLKIHSKQTLHRANGRVWQSELLESLFPRTQKKLIKILQTLDSPNTGIIGPANHYLALSHFYGGNKDKIKQLLTKTIRSLPNDNLRRLGFFGGTMFWARIESINPILDLYLQPEDFESESGQIDGTLAHALERVLCAVPAIQGKTNYIISPKGLKAASAKDLLHKYDYAEPVDELE